MSGYSACVSMTLPMARTPRSLAASETPKRSAYMTSAPASIWAKAVSLALGGSNHEPMKATWKVAFGLRLADAGHEGVDEAVDLGDREAADDADLAGLGHRPRQ